ncbi:MAG: L,D-transpeptidase family protein [Ignavibacteriales bacterium]|nr:L,D-transpeptidase family protein [Ignavibacteriales bacterium]
MKQFVLLILVVIQLCDAQSFKDEQLRFPRVKTAFKEKSDVVDSLLNKYIIQRSALNIFLRAFKSEKELELWGKNKNDSKYRLITTYPFCETSGGLGPKRKEGDLQIPEGVYSINHFNPTSSFYLSLGINYPNASDAILGVKGKLGGEIYIHGDCVTIGCIPITDDLMKELYVVAVEARNSGQTEIPVHIFPTRLDRNGLSALRKYLPSDSITHLFWNNLEPIYRQFEETRTLKPVEVDSRGRYFIR